MEITDILLHRKPFLFVDSIEEANDKTIKGSYTYKEDEFFFKGHFPTHPVVPGVLLVEMMAQVGGAGLGMAETMEPGSLFVLGSIEKAKFRKQVRPLDKVQVEVENLRVSKFLIKQKGIAKVNGEVCAEATWLCVLASKDAM